MRKQPIVRYQNGEVVKLNTRQQRLADYNQRICNDLGYDINITTLTSIQASIVEQMFYEIFPADYFAVRAGQGAWSDFLTTYRSFNVAEEFETGIINVAGQDARLSTADAAIDAVQIRVFNWAKQIGWSLPELMQASRAGNFDLITQKEISRKKNWDLGLQRIAFLGARGQNNVGGACLGFLNQAGVTVNTTIITKPISTMTTTELKAFMGAFIQAFRANAQYTVYPSVFTVPESDYNGMASLASADFPDFTILEILEKMFKVICKNPNFKIMPLAYADATEHTDVTSIAGQQVYVLSTYDDNALRMDVPVPYTNTLANSMNSFQYQAAAYGQFTGVLAYRPREIMYFVYSAS